MSTDVFKFGDDSSQFSVVSNSQTIVDIWVAKCSDTSNSVLDCKKFTDELISKFSEFDYPDEQNQFAAIAFYVRIIFMNRGNDMEFLKKMWEYKSRYMDISVVDCILQTNSLSANIESDVDTWISEYIKRHGEDTEILTLQLRLYNSPVRYAKNKDKINEIVSKLESR